MGFKVPKMSTPGLRYHQASTKNVNKNLTIINHQGRINYQSINYRGC